MKTQDGASAVRDPVFLAERGISKKGVIDRKLAPSAEEDMSITAALKDSQIPITLHSDTLARGQPITVSIQHQTQINHLPVLNQWYSYLVLQDVIFTFRRSLNIQTVQWFFVMQ